MQQKTTSVAAASVAVGLNIHKGKSKIFRCNTACTIPITIDGEDSEDVKTSTYLGSIIDEQGGSDADVKARIRKVRAVYLQLKNIWNSKQLSTNTKVRIFNTNVNTLENNESHHPEDTDVYKQLSTQKYFRSVGRTLLATTNCGKEQTRSQPRKKSGRSAGSG
ncbi:unnamed protein product [Schistosoma mattheei]|uniref:Uncharacterized protein n=1 Tax=Schistosoma mattheei TaxID=31246 RepID=A0A183NDM8_9TREM|nr:unnamed protein product [Schistosoma mattheei]